MLVMDGVRVKGRDEAEMCKKIGQTAMLPIQ